MARSAHGRTQSRRLVTVIVVLVVVVGLVTAGILSLPGASSSTSGQLKPTDVSKAKKQPATFVGPDGVEASWVIAQNKLPGTTAWKITTPQTGTGIEGYTSRPQVHAGQSMEIYVSTSSPTYVIYAYRMGYYQGKGGRLIWRSPELKGAVQPGCTESAPLYMVQCNWSSAITIKVNSQWVQGDYLLKLVASNGAESYIPVTVWDPNSHATYVIMNANITWQAFNSYGGYDLYAQGTSTATGYPPPDRSRVLSFDRPYNYGNGAANFLTNEYPLVRLMEKEGLNVTYWTDITLAVHGSLLTNHRVLISLGHDEEWSTRMRANAVAAHNQGVNLIFFGASPVLRKVRIQSSPLGPNLEIVNYRDPQEDPLYGKDNAEVTQNWWGQPPADLPAAGLVGGTYIGFNNNQAFPLVVSEPNSWLYAGTGLKSGQSIPNVLKYDFQGYDVNRANPPTDEILAHSPVVIGFDGAHMYADTTYWTDPTSKAGVFSSGTNEWIADLQQCPAGTAVSQCPSQDIRILTNNVLRLFGSGPTGQTDPSVSNASQFYPATTG